MKRDDAERFMDYLHELKERDRGALAALRHSLAFEPGDDPKAYPFVEKRFVGREWHYRDARRLALYAVAGLFASHPVFEERSLAAAFGGLVRRRITAGRESDKQRPSTERRFMSLLETDSNSVMSHLRQAVSLLSAEGIGYDHAGLLIDLAVLLNDHVEPDWRDDIKRRWARQFYRALQPDEAPQAPTQAPTVQ